MFDVFLSGPTNVEEPVQLLMKDAGTVFLLHSNQSGMEDPSTYIRGIFQSISLNAHETLKFSLSWHKCSNFDLRQPKV